MIELRELDGFKLVRGENIANSHDTLRAIEEAVVQGSQGWGVVDEQSVLLAVVRELRAALTASAQVESLSAELETAGNFLKGKQMELGRVQAKLVRATQHCVDGDVEHGETLSRLDKTEKALKEITKRHGGLLEVIAAQAETIAEVTAERDNPARQNDEAANLNAIIGAKDDRIRELTTELDAARAAGLGLLRENS